MAGPKSEIVLGMIGTDSGPIGQVFVPIVEAAHAWLADVNARGGVNGHAVRLVAGDDGGEPGRALALARRMIDQDHVIAFFAEHGATSFQAVMPLLEERKIPLIGTCSCTAPVANSPMAFDPGPGGDKGLAWSHIAALVPLSDKRKVSVLYCREAISCTKVRDGVRTWAKQLGLEIVHEAQVTLTQPDYTAEVLAARSAGAEALVLALDNPSNRRVARSAHRQDYNPLLSMNWTTQDQRALDQGMNDLEGAVFGSPAPPFESPKLADYLAALKRYAPGAAGAAATGVTTWGGGKLLEVAGKNLPNSASSADMLKGLYALNGETLGGLFPPVTFIEGKSPEGANLCLHPLKVEGGKITAPKGEDDFECAPGWSPRRK